jgi:CheY-like chemotaxis protein
MHKKRIVLVEDDDVLINLLVGRLEEAGYGVKVARDGIDGLNMVKKEKPDLLLLDILLPSMDGFTILEKLNEEEILPDLPTIVISNSGQPVEVERAIRLGVRDYLVKVNFSASEVLEKIEQLSL